MALASGLAGSGVSWWDAWVGQERGMDSQVLCTCFEKGRCHYWTQAPNKHTWFYTTRNPHGLCRCLCHHEPVLGVRFKHLACGRGGVLQLLKKGNTHSFRACINRGQQLPPHTAQDLSPTTQELFTHTLVTSSTSCMRFHWFLV